jgi:hypothetical protein
MTHRAVFAAAIAVSGAFWLLPSVAEANSPIDSYSAVPSTTQAGGHPDISVRFAVENRADQPPNDCACSDPKDITIASPTGVVGDPHAAPGCSQADFATLSCPTDSQIGLQEFGFGLIPVYNLIPRPGEAGLFGSEIPLVFPLFQIVTSRTGSDYGLNITVPGITHILPLPPFNQKLWGVPEDASHDAARFPFQRSVCYEHGTIDTTSLGGIGCSDNASPPWQPVPSNSPVKPFTENPTTCGVPLTASLDVLSYDHGTSHADYPWPATTGCDQLSFNPSNFTQPTTQQTDSASGSDVDITVPQETSPSVPSPSEIRATTVTLPPDFSINPNAADGKMSCSDAQASFGTEDAAQCPEFSKVGTLTLTSALLPGPLPGFIYLGDPKPGDRYRLILTADGFSTHVKLAGSIIPDPATGQVKISFPDLPQTPLEDFNMHFFGSERGLLATPTQCGTYPVQSTFTPWDAALPDQHSTQFFVLNSGPNGGPCPGPQRPFSPGFEAGVDDNTAGAHSPFTLKLTRSDGDQNLSALDVSTPPGFSATLAGIPYCPEAAIAAAEDSSYSGLAEQANPSCPAASQIGTAVAGAGAGTHPVYVSGKVYLAGPYKGAPLSLVVITPALSGPYDLGNVMVRAALNVDPSDAHITAVSDPLPKILQGIPLRLRSILVNLNRPNFTLNPTNCDPFAVGAKVFGDQGTEADLSTHFQAASCTNLGFAPKLALRLSGGSKRNGHPAIHATLSAKAGDANIASTAVTMPPSEQLDQSHLSAPCTKAQFEASTCPAGSVIGSAKAITPLLDKPLSGNVYLVSEGNPLPDVVAALRGQIDINLTGKVDTAHGGLRTTFQTVPDAPVTSFNLDLAGGGKGLVVNNTSICGAPLTASVKVRGQNGLSANQNPVLGVPCGKARHKRHVQHARAVR